MTTELAPTSTLVDVRMERAASVVPATWDADALTFEATIATPHPVRRRDARGEYLEILDTATLNLSSTATLPIYDGHRGGTARATIGVVESVRVHQESVVATLRLSAADDVTPIRQRVAEGTIRHTSAGYRVGSWRESRDEKGNRVKTPNEWSLREVSLVPNPADPNARIRAAEIAPDATARSGGNPINNRASTGVTMTEDTTLDRFEIERRSEIRGLCRAAGLTDLQTDDLIDRGANVDEAKAAAFDHMQTRSASRPVIRTANVRNDDPQVIVRRQSDAVATRMAGGDCPEDARQYLGDSMQDLARSALERAGQSTRGMSGDELFERAAHGTSDFPLVVSNAMGKTAAQAYQAAESPLKALCRQRVLRDFKTTTSIRLGGMGRLEELAENGEITATSRAENGESMALRTYARGINVSRNLLINDDLGLLGDMTSAFGTAAAQTEADILVDLVTGNPNMRDGQPVFHTSRGNIAATATSFGDAGHESSVEAARRYLRTVKDLDGKTIISATPRYLLVGPNSETAAEKFLAAIYATSVDNVNAWAGKLSLIVEPRIEDDQWFVFADPARLPCLQYGYLASAKGAQIQRAEAWDTLGLKFRAFLDFGAGWTDHRGAYFNGGSA